MDEDAFDDAVDGATQGVIAALEDRGFAVVGGDELSDLMVRINDALTPLMREAIKE